MQIAVASEHRGFLTKVKIMAQLQDLHHSILDCGSWSPEMCDYPDYAAAAAREVSGGRVGRAILVGGTGIGMCMVANKFRGVRAALCHDELSAEISRRHHDTNILCLAVDIVSERLRQRMIEVWLTASFEGGRHSRRIEKIAGLERQLRGDG